jgi:hypothetical protein
MQFESWGGSPADQRLEAYHNADYAAMRKDSRSIWIHQFALARREMRGAAQRDCAPRNSHDHHITSIEYSEERNLPSYRYMRWTPMLLARIDEVTFFAAIQKSGIVEVFGRRPDSVQTNATLSWPASENLQRRKPRQRVRAVPRWAYQRAPEAGFLYNLSVMARRLLNRGK